MTSLQFIAEILRWFVGMLLLAAALGKLRNLAEFRSNLHTSFGLGGTLSNSVSLALPAAELLVAAMILGLSSQLGMVLALLMFCAFTALVGYKFVTESVVRCSCFGETGRPISSYDLLRNLFVILACIGSLALGTAIMPPLHATILAAALASILCVVAIEFHSMVTLLVRH